jgi:3-phenylpropionate/cinnamic acid dioxygenase small subunit
VTLSEHFATAVTMIAKYSQLWDDRRYEDWIRLFSPDATFDLRGTIAHGRDEIQALIGAGNAARPSGSGMHVMTNPVVAPDREGLRVGSDFVFLARRDHRHDVMYAGRNYDRLIQRRDEWFFESRSVRFLGDERPPGWPGC